MASAALLIFVVSMTGKFLGDETFERLPDFVTNSYSALFSMLTVGGLAGVMAYIQSSRGSQTGVLRYLLYTLGALVILSCLIWAAVTLAPNPMERTLRPPAQAMKMDVTRTDPIEETFTITSAGAQGMRAELTGNISYTRERIKGEVTGGTVTVTQLAGYQLTDDWHADHLSINVCHYMVQDGLPIIRPHPDAIVQVNSTTVDWDFAKHSGEPFAVPAFKFDFRTPSIDFPKIAWLCATITSKSRSFLAIVQ